MVVAQNTIPPPIVSLNSFLEGNAGPSLVVIYDGGRYSVGYIPYDATPGTPEKVVPAFPGRPCRSRCGRQSFSNRPIKQAIPGAASVKMIATKSARALELVLMMSQIRERKIRPKVRKITAMEIFETLRERIEPSMSKAVIGHFYYL